MSSINLNYQNIKDKLISNFAKFFVLNIAKEYLDKTDKYKNGDTPELVLRYLDASLEYSQKNIDVSDASLLKNIVLMNNNEKRRFKKALSKANDYDFLVKKMNFFYSLLKEKELQDIVFEELYKQYNDENKTAQKISTDVNQYQKYGSFSISNLQTTSS